MYYTFINRPSQNSLCQSSICQPYIPRPALSRFTMLLYLLAWFTTLLLVCPIAQSVNGNRNYPRLGAVYAGECTNVCEC